MQYTITFLVLLFYTTSTSGQSNLFTAISESEDHTIFTELLELSGLDELLKDDNYYSVLAPSDEAFRTAFTAAELDSIMLNEQEYLESTLLHHIVTDTVVADLGDGYFPLFGNHIDFFIDAAGNIIIFDGNTSNPYPNVDFPSTEDFDNGRVVWAVNNILKISSDCLSESLEYYSPYVDIIETLGLLDSITESETALTIIIPDYNALADYIDSIGGVDKLAVLDTLIKRQILSGHFAIQDLSDGLLGETWFGDQVLFSVQNDTYYVNGVEIINSRVDKNGVILITASPLPNIEIEEPQVNQTWFTEDEEWVYRFFAPFSTEGYGVMKVAGDTLIDNQSAKVLKINLETVEVSTGWERSSVPSIIAYEENGRVYILNAADEFKLNYDMNLVVGDSIVYWGELPWDEAELCQDSVVYFLDSLSTLEVGTDTLRVQHFTVKDYYWGFETGRTVIEKIGSVEFGMDLLVHLQCYFDGPGYWLCSYENSEEYIKFLDEDCFELPVNTKDVLLEAPSVFPNPTYGILNLEAHELLESVSLYTMDGRFLSEYGSSPKLDISVLHNGSYLLKRSYKNGKKDYVVVQKI